MTSKKLDPSKTLLGMPNDVQAVLERLKAEQAAQAAEAAGADRADHGQPVPVHEPPILPGSEAQPSAARRYGSLHRTLIGVTPVSAPPGGPPGAQAFPVSDVRAQGVAAPQPFLAQTQTLGSIPDLPGGPAPHGADVSGPHRREEPAPRPAANGGAGASPDTGVLDLGLGPAAKPGGWSLATSDELPDPRARRSRDRVAPDKKKLSHARTVTTYKLLRPRRWPAIVLLACAVIALSAALALRAPRLLPQPLAAWLGAPQPAAAPTAPAPAPAQPVTDVSAATADPSDRSALKPPSLLAPVTGEAAEVEKRAVELLIAHDVAAARGLYGVLQKAEPERPEFAIMVKILGRDAKTAPCGGEGQKPCAAP
jgi:hypothetical protein